MTEQANSTSTNESATSQARQENPHHVNQINLENQSKGTDHSLVIANERREAINLEPKESELPPPASQEDWFITKDIKGDGLRPEWLPEKFKSMEDAVKAYSELEKKFAQTRPGEAPDQYEIDIREDLETAGLDVDLENPVLLQFEEFARENKMSNDQFNECINFYLESMNQSLNPSEEEVSAYKAEEMAKLGDEGPQIVSQIKQWGENNLTTDEFALMQEFADSADRIVFLKKLLNVGNTTSVPQNVSASAKYTRDDLKQMMADPRYAMDVNYTKKVDALYKDVWDNNRL